MERIQYEGLILVAVVNRPRDLEIARLLGWYRIPLQSAPKTIRADWLAFYQTAAFGEAKWAVRYVAPIRGYELASRLELLRDESDHPRANEPYFKIQLGPLQELPQPVPSRRWRRFTFLFTTGKRLLTANDLTDLKVPPSQEHDILWKMIKERGG
jgi:hypothetical protein